MARETSTSSFSSAELSNPPFANYPLQKSPTAMDVFSFLDFASYRPAATAPDDTGVPANLEQLGSPGNTNTCCVIA